MSLSAWDVWRLCSDDKGRLLRKHRTRATEVRCAKGHLLAYLLPTASGDLWVRRDPWVERDDTHGWELGWAEDDGAQAARCACQRQWYLDPAKIDRARRSAAPRDLRPDTPSIEHEGESTPFD